jgi:copper chaperone CopZ
MFFHTQGDFVMAFLTVTLKGVCPLLVHNGQLADPLNRFTKDLKEVSSKRKKTDEDFAEISRREWLGGLYVDEEGMAILPSVMIEASIYEGAKKNKLGKAFKSAVFVTKDARLKYPKMRKAVELWGDEKHRSVMAVRVGTARVMRTRPIFHEWSCEVEVNYDENQVNESEVIRAIRDAGDNCGVGTFRPRYGRFAVEVK